MGGMSFLRSRDDRDLRLEIGDRVTGWGIMVGLVVAVEVAVVAVALSGCARPGPMPREVGVAGRVYVPLAPVASYRWPTRGFGHPPESWAVSHAGLVGDRPYWFYDWWWDCTRWSGEGQRYIPAVARAWYPAVLACDDGRPLLVLNEPEDAAQAGLAPAAAAAVLRQAVLAWDGEVWCCGIQVQHLPYARLLLAAYRAEYGDWPAAGWHVHVYSQRDGRTKDAMAMADVQEGLRALDAFTLWAAGEGVLGRGIVVSEYGALADRPVDMAVMEAFEAEFGMRADVISWAWFSVNYGPWAGSDLVGDDGTLTELGRAWSGAER